MDWFITVSTPWWRKDSKFEEGMDAAQSTYDPDSGTLYSSLYSYCTGAGHIVEATCIADQWWDAGQFS